MRVGVSVDALKRYGNSNLIFAMDALHPNDDYESINIGCEYVFNKILSIRAGYKSLFAKDSEEGLSLGVGLNYSIGGVRLILDYAYHKLERFKDIQKFSMGLGF